MGSVASMQATPSYISIAVNESDEADSMTQGFLERTSPEQSHTATTSPMSNTQKSNRQKFYFFFLFAIT